MGMQAGFAEVDISPESFPVRTYWAPVDRLLDPILAQAAVFSNGSGLVGVLSINVVIVEEAYVRRIRERVALACPLAAENLMVCATHNHACPAVVDRPWSAKDEPYLDTMVEKCARAVVDAYHALAPVEWGTGTGYESRIAFNRRYVLKNGSVISQPSLEIIARDVLYAEAIIDPEVGVLAVRDADGTLKGALVNYACHAVHLMGSLSGGFPGVLSDRLKAAYGKDFVCVFLNGPCGNVHHRKWDDPSQEDTKERFGTLLAEEVTRIIGSLDFASEGRVTASSVRLPVRYRDISEFEKSIPDLPRHNVFKGLIDNGWYTWSLEKLRQMHARADHETAEIQTLVIGDTMFGGIPAEYFCQYALRIKEESPLQNTFVVSLANGWLGYIPDRAAFDRIGGHERTWCISSKMEPEAGNQLADALLAQLRELSSC